MKIYYGITNYHLLCSILHKLVFLPKDKAIFVASEGILSNRIKDIEESNIFDKVYYIEDKKIIEEISESLTEKSFNKEIDNISKKFILKYEQFLPFKIEQFKEFFICADHGILGLYLLIKRQQYTYFEDARGIYSAWEKLDKALKVKNPHIRFMALHYNAYGKSDLIVKKYVSFDSQQNKWDQKDCIDFDVNVLLNKLNEEQLKKVFEVFKIRKYELENESKNALVLTQRFSTYNMLSGGECSFLYALISDIFAKGHKIFLKPHPADKVDYRDIFKTQVVLEKEIPSELIRFMVNKKFDIGISTYTSSINSLKPCINNIYNFDDTIIEKKNDIFKLYCIFELAKKINYKVKLKIDSVTKNFINYYNFSSDNNIYFNKKPEKESKDIIIIKDKYFNESNIVIEINRKTDNNFKGIDKLYVKTNNIVLQKKILNFQLDGIFPLSKIKIKSNTKFIE